MEVLLTPHQHMHQTKIIAQVEMYHLLPSWTVYRLLSAGRRFLSGKRGLGKRGLGPADAVPSLRKVTFRGFRV